ncbi:hypothetical protein LPU83_pLPU83d_1469 (plasmid) [Rhizobium favelukesii]|uniref:Uncharacterized protein n=1 Tax=Rhizobium favelukesii TaxID=348824 RepID=W6RQ17_9HYPH|nr:hypothetical protein LPU83_pLPU83d_1469 [Rhizobium favelukesii]
MVLARCHRQLQRPAAIQITVTAVAISLGMKADILVPEDLQRHMLALQFPVNKSPIRLSAAAMTGLRAGSLVESRFQHRIADVLAQRPGKPSNVHTAQRLTHRRRRRTNAHRNRLVAKAFLKSVSQYLADTPHLQSLRWHRVPSSQATERTNVSPAEHPDKHPNQRAASSRNKGAVNSRNWGAALFRNAGADCLGICSPRCQKA